MAGKYVWYDLMTTDMEAAQAFYGEITGWKTQSWDGGDYTMWTLGEQGPFGGLSVLSDDAKAMGAPPHWIGYVGVDDLDVTVKQAAELGGAVIVPPTQIGERSRFAIMSDPQGAVFAAYSSSDPADVDWARPSGVGSFAWGELNTTDWKAARDFYTTLFGWQQTATMDMGGAEGDDGTYWMFGVDAEKSLGGMSNMAKTHGMPAHWLHYVTTADLDSAIERVKSNGGKVMNGPMDIPGGDRIAQCVDPQGAFFALYEEGER